ncbi:MAG TPA: DEAD/DEAH box helicase family protein [Anaerolineae bacterium]|nr:DEAD/DEAH box helicase family protein [Anaerolineae bacterium]
MFPLVALDLETTGLNPQRDAIIEIGAVRFNGNEVQGTYKQLVNPRRPIPPEITQLTHITNEMVSTAPILKEVLGELTEFVTDLPVLGHNVPFDLSFLRLHSILRDNPQLDTYDLAAVLMPTASRYNLSALREQLEIDFADIHAHRALDDALMTQKVFSQLYQKAQSLPIELVTEIVHQGQHIDWGGQWFFSQLLRERAKEPLKARKVQQKIFGVLFGKPSELLTAPMKANKELLPLDEEEVAAYLEHGGAFAQYLQNFESRPQQIDMVKSVAHALSESQHLMVEAGTGIGKSFAYLVPAALWATKNNARVVISTNTINLQDQLMGKDIPDLCGAMQLDLRATVLKGRSNYLCPRRLEAMRHRGPNSPEELRVLAKVLVWLRQGGTGDRSEINLNGPLEREAWSRLSAEDETCNGEVCLSRMGGICPYFQARQRALNAHIIVVNHALLLADVITENRVLPEYKHLIVDEAHHLESASTSALSYHVTNRDLERLLGELGSTTSGALGRMMALLNHRMKPAQFAAFGDAISHATDLAFRLEHELKKVFRVLDGFMEDMREGKQISDYGQKVRVIPATLHQPAWSEIEILWDGTNHTIEALLQLLSSILRDVADIEISQELDVEEALGDIASVHRRLTEAQLHFTSLINDPNTGYIYWIEVGKRGNNLSIHVAPLHIGPLMEKYLWHEKECIILTSATLTTGGEFDYLRSRLNADEADELVLGSPFDYENATLLYLPNDIPEPSDYNQYQRWVERALIRLAKATSGRMLALFTSYKQLRRTSRVLTPILNEAEIQVYEQGEGASSSALLETFRTTERAVLLGTRAFWEGVDVPGEALSVLAIIRLPFDVPSDPIIAARAETFEDPFSEYTLPEAILRFRQGFGRLIRTQSDRGVVAILDRRVLTKQYGKLFTDSLPQCSVQIGLIEELPKAASRWLNL